MGGKNCLVKFFHYSEFLDRTFLYGRIYAVPSYTLKTIQNTCNTVQICVSVYIVTCSRDI